MTHAPHDLAALYAIDALDDHERVRFEQHLANCGSCAREVAELQETAAALGASLALTPPAGLRSRVLSQLADTPQVAPGPVDLASSPTDLRSRRRGRSPLLAAAAVLVAAVGFGAGLFVFDFAADGPSSEVAQVLEADDRVVLDLSPTADAEGGTIEVAWSPDLDRAVVTGTGLSDAGPGRAYALWFVLSETEVAPAGLFNPEDGQVSELLELEDLDPAGWGVTIEPDSGSPQPTGDILYLDTF